MVLDDRRLHAEPRRLALDVEIAVHDAVGGHDLQQGAHRAVGEVLEPALVVEIADEVEDALEILSRHAHDHAGAGPSLSSEDSFRCRAGKKIDKRPGAFPIDRHGRERGSVDGVILDVGRQRADQAQALVAPAMNTLRLGSGRALRPRSWCLAAAQARRTRSRGYRAPAGYARREQTETYRRTGSKSLARSASYSR
jgi:hypothetical protein